MTAKEAIDYLLDPIGKREQHDEAIRMAISALEKQDVPDTNVGDMISRRAAIDVVRRCSVKEVTPAYMLIDKAGVMTELMMLPSAQPEQDAYEQGRITGRVEMRTKILSALKKMVGSEVWNNV